MADSVHFNIAAQPLPAALKTFATQANMQLLYRFEVVESATANPVIGDFDKRAALEMLLVGTGLEAIYSKDNAATIRPARAKSHTASKTTAVQGTNGYMHLAQAETNPSAQDVRSESGDNSSRASAEAERGIVLDEIVVTGTHIPGAALTSPVMVFTRKDIDNSGSSSVQQFLGGLPQNFGGGASEDTTLMGGSGRAEFGFGAGVNLRGLGSSSTLVLVNGRRSAAAGQAEYTDVSMIPLSAVERIEVVPDGASATYGSDAVGGVVNIILRRDFRGAESLLRGGAATQGGATERQAAQTFGARWGSGGASVNFEYYERDAVQSEDRDFSSQGSEATQDLFGPRNLLPAQEKRSVYVAADQQIAGRLELFGDFAYTNRPARYTNWNAFGGPTFSGAPQYYDTESKQYGASLGARHGIAGDWTLELIGNGSRAVIDSDITDSVGNPVNTIHSTYRLKDVDAKAVGTLLSVPAGAIKGALGASYRKENYDFRDSFSVVPNEYSVSAQFAELIVPLLGKRADSKNPRLVATLAARHEHYSNFGSTLDPKFGLRWQVTDSIALRGTFANSFKAPDGWQLSDFNIGRVRSNLPDPNSPTGTTRTVVRFGNNPDLHEQTAKSWTLGLQWESQDHPGTGVDLTLFNDEYKDRITGLVSVQPRAAMLNDPTYADYVTHRGELSDADFDALVLSILRRGCAAGDTSGNCTEPPANFNAILDLRLTNIAELRTRGVDAVARLRLDRAIGIVDLDLNANYLFDYEQKIAEGQPARNFLNNVYNPVDLRALARATLTRGPMQVGASVSYQDAYKNRGINDITGLSLPASDIASWTTMDLDFQYDLPSRAGGRFPGGLKLMLHVANVFDRDPPFLNDGSFGLGYDPANGDPLGRVISAQLRMSW